MTEPLDLLLFHAHFLHAFPVEGRVLRPYAPIGPRYVAAYLKEAGFEVGWFDSTFKPEVAHFEIELSRRRPRTVGLYAHNATRDRAFEMIACARKFGATVLAGGPDATRHPDLYLARGVDLVVRGEGEATAAEIASLLRARGWRFRPEDFGRVAGVTFFGRDGRFDTPDRPLPQDLDALPWPLRPVEQMRAYQEEWRAVHGYTAVVLGTSRGVPGSPGYRRRRPDRVADEVGWLFGTFRPDRVRVVDAVYTGDPDWHREFADVLKARRLQPRFNCLGRPRDLTRAAVAALKRQGVYRVALEVPSGSGRLLRAMDAGFGPEDVYAAARHLREEGIDLALFLHLGLPGETKGDVRATIEMVEVLDPVGFGVSVTDPSVAKAVPAFVSVADPPPGTPGPRYSANFYRWALRLLTARMTLRKGRAEGASAVALAGQALRVPLYRAAVGVYLPRLPALVRRGGGGG